MPPGSSDDVALLVGQSALDLAPALARGDETAAVVREDGPRLTYVQNGWRGRMELTR